MFMANISFQTKSPPKSSPSPLIARITPHDCFSLRLSPVALKESCEDGRSFSRPDQGGQISEGGYRAGTEKTK